jgi:hypothetical protein
MPSSFSLTRAAAAAVLAAAALQPAHAINYTESYNQLYGPGYALPFPGCCTWAPNTIGWYWAPQQTFALSTIETILVNVLNGVNDDFDLTVTLYSDRPAAGGTAIASAVFNPGSFYAADPSWHGNAFTAPVVVNAGTSYFVGFSGWNNSQTAGGARGGINWVLQPDQPGGVPPGAQFLGNAYIGDSFETAIGTATSVTAAPVIKFVGDTNLSPVPEPSTAALGLMGLAFLGLALKHRCAPAA